MSGYVMLDHVRPGQVWLILFRTGEVYLGQVSSV